MPGIEDRLVRIEVIGDPGGGPPDWIRESWLGVEFEATPVCDPLAKYKESTPEKRPVEPMPTWEVEAQVAVEALRLFGREEAARWWLESGLLGARTILAFPITSCRPINGSDVIFPYLN